MNTIEIKKFPDKASYAVVNNFPKEFTFRINDYTSIVQLLQILEVYKHNEQPEPIVTIPNLLDAQADKRDHENSSLGLPIVANLLNLYPAKYKIFHPHNEGLTLALINNSKVIKNTELVDRALEKISDRYYNGDRSKMEKNSYLMSTDAGGFKPLIDLCGYLNWTGKHTSGSKNRSWDEKEGVPVFVQELANSKFDGKDIIIVDDIIIRGGTIKGICNLLSETDCGDIYVISSHMTIEDLGKDPLTNYVKEIFTSNSKYPKYFSGDKEITKGLNIINLFK